jgi:hypothetical protein
MPTEDTLTFQFWQSPPVLHADIKLKRTSAGPPDMSAITSTMDTPYTQCTFKDHYGPNFPVNPSLRPNTTSTFAQHSAAYKTLAGPTSVGCAAGLKMRASVQKAISDATAELDPNAAGECRQLNGVNLELSKATPFKHFDPIPDVKVQYIPPTMPCAPCDVAYSVSAAIGEDEYIGVGFKGQSWEAKFPISPFNEKRPCYFGMCVDKYDNFTSDRLAIGYSGGTGACFREMVSPNLIGSPVDVPTGSKIMKNVGVTRQASRTVLKFTLSQHWPDVMPNDGPWRIMWATGKVVSATTCASSLGYHAKNRGVAPLYWLKAIEGADGKGIGSTACKYEPGEMDF